MNYSKNKIVALFYRLAGSIVGKVFLAVLIPVITGFVLVQGYLFLRDTNAPKLFIGFIAVLWGVGGVLALYFIANWLINMLPPKIGSKLVPFLFVGTALVILTWYLLFPTIRSVYFSFHDDSEKIYKILNEKQIRKGNTVVSKTPFTDEDKKVIVTILKEINFYDDYSKWIDKTENMDAYRVKYGELPEAIPEFYFVKELIPKLTGGFQQQQLFRSVYKPTDRFTFFGNYLKAFKSRDFMISLRNNLIWILLGPTLAVLFGLIIALLADRSDFEILAKALIFMPMAISFIGAGVIWKFIYAYQPAGENQIGLLNAIVTAFGGQPQNWLTLSPLNSVLLVFILVWMQTGYAMVLISSAIKGVPEDLYEAARIDGAGEMRIIISVVIPYIKGTIITVGTTIMILSLKIFDIVYSMTGGNFSSDVLATLQYREMFVYKNYNMGATYAIILLIAVLPAVIYNIKQFKDREAF